MLKIIDKSSSLIAAEYGSMSIREQFFQSLATSSEYRHAFVEEKIRTGLAVQIKTIRERREGLTQVAFAEKLGKTQSWVSRLEDPNEPIPTISSLLLVARAFDVGLEVRFVPFADLLDDITELSEGSLDVPEFDRDPKLFLRKGPESATTWRPRNQAEIRTEDVLAAHASWDSEPMNPPVPTGFQLHNVHQLTSEAAQ